MAFSDADTNSAMPSFTDDKSGSDDVRGMNDPLTPSHSELQF
jgi:hypothetical protein